MTPILGVIASSNQQGRTTAVGSYDSLGSIILPTAVSTVTFAGLPIGYQHLQIRSTVLNSGGENNLYIRFNDDTSANYTYEYLRGLGSTGAADYGISNTFAYAGYMSNGTSSYGSFITDILEYAKTNKTKVLKTLWGFASTSSSATALQGNLWNSTAAITSITIYTNAANFVAGSRFDIYGVK